MITPAEQKRLDTLIPECKRLVETLIENMTKEGFDVFVGQTRRTSAQQHDAQERGTTSAKQSVSWHELDRAADLRKRLPDGTGDPTTHDEAFFLALYYQAEAIGLRSLGYHVVNEKLEKLLINGKTWDAGHVEYRAPYKTLAEAVKVEGSKIV